LTWSLPAPAFATTRPARSDTSPSRSPQKPNDHKAYYPGSRPIRMRYTGDPDDGRLLGLQLVGGLHSEIAKRVGIATSAIFNGMTIDSMSDLDLSYTPPLGSPWDALQEGAQRWTERARSS
jgi:NADPH-dependent 2,4-dienoyl-CoA reductase/sulfur reductase-like enzyme